MDVELLVETSAVLIAGLKRNKFEWLIQLSMNWAISELLSIKKKISLSLLCNFTERINSLFSSVYQLCLSKYFPVLTLLAAEQLDRGEHGIY